MCSSHVNLDVKQPTCVSPWDNAIFFCISRVFLAFGAMLASLNVSILALGAIWMVSEAQSILRSTQANGMPGGAEIQYRWAKWYTTAALDVLAYSRDNCGHTTRNLSTFRGGICGIRHLCAHRIVPYWFHTNLVNYFGLGKGPWDIKTSSRLELVFLREARTSSY